MNLHALFTCRNKYKFLLMDLNNATPEQISNAVPMIGKDKAQTLIDMRQKMGGFKSWDDVKKVPGFSDEMVNGLRDAGMTVGGEEEDEEEE
jgi:competence ComEA-like helix-hairpin-helix protein